MVRIGIEPAAEDGETGLAALSALPVSFIGLACFRAWMWLLAMMPLQAPALEEFHDCMLTVFLVALVLLARHVVPLCAQRWAHALCFAAACFGAVLTLIAGFAAAPAFTGYAAMLFVALASSLFILSWCELYSCLEAARIALCLALVYVGEQALIVLLGGLALEYRQMALFMLPAASLLMLLRAYAYVPEPARPRPVPGKLRIPWKLILLLAAYDFVSGMRTGMAAGVDNPFAGIASVLVAGFLIVAIVFFSDRFDLAMVYHTPIVLLVSVLLLVPALGIAGDNVLAFCLALSVRLFEVVLFLLLCDMSKRLAIMALVLFGVEESAVIFGSFGYAAGDLIRSVPALAGYGTAALLLGVALLVVATVLLFNDKRLASEWGGALFGPGKIRWNQERRNKLTAACDRVAEEYRLSPREREVLELLGEGKSIARVCETLCIAKGTAKAHTEHIYTKTGINSRRQLLDMLSVEQPKDA